jgi:hypothetical protein
MPYCTGGLIGRMPPSGPGRAVRCAARRSASVAYAAASAGATAFGRPAVQPARGGATRFGVDDQDPPSRVAVAKCRQERRRQLHLARTRLRVVLGVPGEQRLGLRQCVADLGGDRGEFADLLLIQPHRHAALPKRAHERHDSLGIRPAITDKQIEVGHDCSLHPAPCDIDSPPRPGSPARQVLHTSGRRRASLMQTALVDDLQALGAACQSVRGCCKSSPTGVVNLLGNRAIGRRERNLSLRGV